MLMALALPIAGVVLFVVIAINLWRLFCGSASGEDPAPGRAYGCLREQ
jgi:TRAP-type C4-dicarboxylate transport system permease small subunit